MGVSKEIILSLKQKLKDTFGFTQFRGEQEKIIHNLLEGRHTFVLMPTGAGKSLCYQLPAIISEGTAIVISPLIALMKNQVDQLNAFGINAQFLNSSLTKPEIKTVKAAVTSGEVKLLYIAPESLNKEENLSFLKKAKISFVAIDEAHCISEWGHDFRPEYRKIRNIIENLDPKLPIIALTATATPKVQADIQKTLNLDDATVFKSSFNRKNLFYEIRAKRPDIDKQIIRYIKSNHRKSGIIYCLSRKKVEEIAELLNINGINALPYHAGLDSDIRMSNQEAFLNEETEVMVATIAFGMGIDKPDVRFVIHYDAPKSLEGYYQETGRAGRDGLEGACIMFYAKDDITKLDKFNKDKSANEKENSKMLLNEMVAFSNLGTCRRRQLLHYFGEYMDQDCGQCDNCKKPRPKFKVENEVLIAIKAVEETNGEFDAQHIADVIVGNGNQNVTAFSHSELSVFGTGKDSFIEKENDDNDDEDDDDEEIEYSDEEDSEGNPIPKAKKPKTQKAKKKKGYEQTPAEIWTSVVRQLMVLGYLGKGVDNYSEVKLSKKGIDYKEDTYPITLSKDHDYEHDEDVNEEEKEVGTGASSYDVALFELLKNLRKKISKDKNLPPYVIFQDPSLEEMATTYPITNEDMAQINGVGMGKVVKFGKLFIDLIKKYVDDNDIETATEVVVKSSINRSKIKIHIIQQVDRKVDLDIIAEQKELAMSEILEEIEHICYSGTKLNLDYYINQVIEPDKQEEIFEYFMNSSSDNIALAMETCDIEDISEEELRLMRVKFLSEVAN